MICIYCFVKPQTITNQLHIFERLVIIGRRLLKGCEGEGLRREGPGLRSLRNNNDTTTTTTTTTTTKTTTTTTTTTDNDNDDHDNNDNNNDKCLLLFRHPPLVCGAFRSIFQG